MIYEQGKLYRKGGWADGFVGVCEDLLLKSQWYTEW